MLFLDDRKRHRDYETEILRCQELLRTKYNCEQREIEQMMSEFDELDKRLSTGKQEEADIGLRN